MLDKTIRHLMQREANVLQADFLADDIEGRGREPVVHRAHHAREHRPVTDAGVEHAHRWRPRMDIGELKAHPRSNFPLLRASVHEEQILLPVVKETKIALRVVAGEPGSDRWHGCRFHDRQNSRRRRLEQKAAARGSAVRIARHEGMDAIERVGRDTSAVAQTACELAVVDRTAAEGRFGEPPRPAKLADLLENLFVHEALPAGSQAAVMATSEPTPIPAVNYKYAIGKRGQGGWAACPPIKDPIFRQKMLTNSGLRLGTTRRWNMAHPHGQARGHCGQAPCRLPVDRRLRSRRKPSRSRPARGCRSGRSAFRPWFPCGRRASRAGRMGPASGWDRRHWRPHPGNRGAYRSAAASPREDAEDDMGGLRLAVRPRYRSGLDGIETEKAIIVGRRTAEAQESGVRPRAIVSRMGITALRVRLPNFDHGVVDRHTIAIENATLNTDLGAGSIRGYEIGARRFLPVIGFLALFRPPFTAAVRRQAIGEKRTDGLRGSDLGH